MRTSLRLLGIVTTICSASAALSADPPDRDRRRSPIVEVFEKSRDAVVNISTTRTVRMRSLRHLSPLDDIFDFGLPRAENQQVTSIGSGVVVHESGYIVTNAHVVSQASDVKITFADGGTLPADIVAVDADHDLAVLKVNAEHPLPFQKLGRSDDIMVGETVIAIGNPMGLKHTVTTGIVSALGRDLSFGNDVTYHDLIQTDASINPGNSGGPLLNINDELIGINTAIRGDAQNIGFAIPVDRLWELLPAMLDIERHERVRFGLGVSGPDAEIRTIQPDSPAAQADLKPGDRIVRFDGQPIRDGIDYYVRLLGQHAGSDVKLGVQRGHKLTEVSLIMQALPQPDGAELGRRLLGLELAPVPDRIRKNYDLPAHVGLIAQDVERGSPADAAGMRAGDLILRLDRVTATSLKDVGLALERVGQGQRVTVEGLRLQADPAFFWTVSIKTRK